METKIGNELEFLRKERELFLCGLENAVDAAKGGYGNVLPIADMKRHYSTLMLIQNTVLTIRNTRKKLILDELPRNITKEIIWYIVDKFIETVEPWRTFDDVKSSLRNEIMRDCQ